jgi:hypothetical protein
VRMINFGKSFRIQSETPIESGVIFEVGQWHGCPRGSALMMDNSRSIDFAMTERREICLVAEFIFYRFGDRDAWAVDTLCKAAIRGEEEAYA